MNIRPVISIEILHEVDGGIGEAVFTERSVTFNKESLSTSSTERQSLHASDRELSFIFRGIGRGGGLGGGVKGFLKKAKCFLTP